VDARRKVGHDSKIMDGSNKSGERIAKVMARAGLASRREAEAWIAAGRVSVNGAVIVSPALNIGPRDAIAVDGVPLGQRERTRLFLYHKVPGLVTTHHDPEGRPTIFDALPKELPRLISVGRLDLNTEGLLLLTNDGGLARAVELPSTAWLRRYRVRAFGEVTQPQLDGLRKGVTIDGVRYGAIEATFERQQGSNVWLTFAIREGKNREVRNVLRSLHLHVNRLIRVAFGPFELGELPDGAVQEIDTAALKKLLGPEIVAKARADFSGPILDHSVAASPAAGSDDHARVREQRRKQKSKQRSSTSARNDPKASGFHQRRTRKDEKEAENPPQRPARKPRRGRADRSGGPRPSRPR
jgi:23S rRNA pseudouridine2605 synthase